MKKIIYCDRGWFPLFYAFCPTEDAWDREVKRLDDPKARYPEHEAATSKIFDDRKGEQNSICIVTLRKDKHADFRRHDPGTVALLVHEAVHVWQAMMEAMGERDRPRSEIEAYAIQCIFAELYRAAIRSLAPVPLTKRKRRRKR